MGFLILGASTTVFVAWFFAASSRRVWQGNREVQVLLDEHLVTLSFIETAGCQTHEARVEHWSEYSYSFADPAAWHAYQREQLEQAEQVRSGGGNKVGSASIYRPPTWGPIADPLRSADAVLPNQTLVQIRAGWPMPAFRGEAIADGFPGTWGTWRSDYVRAKDMVIFPYEWSHRWDRWYYRFGDAACPTRIEWPGFLANVAYWSCVWLGVWIGVRRGAWPALAWGWSRLWFSKRRRRLRLGLCLRCGYNLKGLTQINPSGGSCTVTCPECGRANRPAQNNSMSQEG